MKKLFLLLALFLMCHLGMVQTNDSIWKPFEAKFTTSGSIFQGNGYRIRTESIEIPPYKSRVVRYLRIAQCFTGRLPWSNQLVEERKFPDRPIDLQSSETRTCFASHARVDRSTG